ncbi:MAG: efflux RND transporter periplasmic adaptor subunit [Saprospiraceae bacterium]
MKKVHLIIFLGFLLVFIYQCKSKDESGENAITAQEAKTGGGMHDAGNGPVYSSIIAKGRVVSREITAPGSILSEENTNLQPEISGRLTGIYFKEGALVNKGALLAKLYDGDLKAQRSKLEVQLKIAEATEGRQKELLAINGTSRQEYDLATLQVSNIKADLDLNSVSLSKTEIRAPYYGRIGLRNVSLGAYVTPQQILANIAQVTTLKIEFTILEKYAHDLKPGKVINFRTESSDKVYQAKITAFENSLTSDTRQLRIRAQVIRPDDRLTPGSFISVTFGVGSNEPAIMIPAQAVIPQARDKKVIVYKSGIASFATVETGYRDSSDIEIVSGLRLGDTIVTTGLLSIRPGTKISTQVSE